MTMLKNGAHGDGVKELQQKLGQLGFKVEADGAFGKHTEECVKQLQKLFGYTIDGIVGDGTTQLIDAQIGYGWNFNDADAVEKAAASTGAPATDASQAKKV